MKTAIVVKKVIVKGVGKDWLKMRARKTTLAVWRLGNEEASILSMKL